MPSAGHNERRPSKEEFTREVEVAIRTAGFEGEFIRDTAKGLLCISETACLNVDHLYADLGGADAKRRLERLAQAAHILVHPPKLPDTWAEVEDRVIPQLKTRIALVIEALRRGAASALGAKETIEVTPHLAFGLGYPAEDRMTLNITSDVLAKWGISPEAAFSAAARNLAHRSQGAWGPMKDAPGVYVGPWHDGYDGSRLFLVGAFRSLQLRGRPVVLLPNPRTMLVAGSEDEGGLFQLGLVGRRMFEKDRSLYVQRAVRQASDGVSWEDWMPAKGHSAHEVLRLLRSLEEVHDYEEHAKAVVEVAKAKGQDPVALPRLELFQSSMGAEVLTLTTWRAGKPAALPKADAILLRRGQEALGVAHWDDVAKELPGELRPLPGYPARHLASSFPEDWQLGGLDLQPWTGPARL